TLVPDHRENRGALDRGEMAATRRCVARHSHRRYRVHGVESVSGERKGVHDLAAVLHHRVLVHHRMDRGARYTESRPPDPPGLFSARTGLLESPGGISSSSSCRTGAADDAVADDSPLEARAGRSWCAHSWPHAGYLQAGARGLLAAYQ